MCNTKNCQLKMLNKPSNKFSILQVDYCTLYVLTPMLQVLFKVVPVKDVKSINISFPIPDVSEHYESKVSSLSDQKQISPFTL